MDMSNVVVGAFYHANNKVVRVEHVGSRGVEVVNVDGSYGWVSFDDLSYICRVGDQFDTNENTRVCITDITNSNITIVTMKPVVTWVPDQSTALTLSVNNFTKLVEKQQKLVVETTPVKKEVRARRSTGRKLTPEQRKSISEGMKKRWAELRQSN